VDNILLPTAPILTVGITYNSPQNILNITHRKNTLISIKIKSIPVIHTIHNPNSNNNHILYIIYK